MDESFVGNYRIDNKPKSLRRQGGYQGVSRTLEQVTCTVVLVLINLHNKG